ncbi:hypothetical protein ASC61_08060 [Aeromicrobium sp. Root344]|uniref:PD40 domain-containing protein n=1 Tax=Aeromicrobium sp. Root344 TaxID=1736521 RepID=UPI0006F9C014|nr:PD40 domain-containing protein [Aeromicrobium sp. Root344]KQV74954.1 hypothetical protein ASC61_08060 [Aeromicrobium sp. Root344]
MSTRRRIAAISMALLVSGTGLPATSTAATHDTPHLPKTVNAPGTWSDDEASTGRLAAIGVAMRTRPSGLNGKRESPELFGVSATDGRSRWVELPGVGRDVLGLSTWMALSPDGRWLAWARVETTNADSIDETTELLGWAVMSTMNRKVRNLDAPAGGRIRGTLADLVFSGDSRHLLASYESADAPRTKGHEFVAWDVTDGTPTVLEKPGHYWLPNPGSAPDALVWARGRTVYRQDPVSGKRASYALSGNVVTASWSPNDTSFAYISQPADLGGGQWVLHAGRSVEEARHHRVPLDVDPEELLGWRDDRHVVVGHFRRNVQVVDVVTGTVVTIDMAGRGKIFNAPLLATDLWQRPLGSVAKPSGTSDPRGPLRWAGGAIAVLLGGFLLLRLRRAPRSRSTIMTP